MIQKILSQTCTEQWGASIIDNNQWSKTGDVFLNNDESLSFYRDINNNYATGDIGGIAWQNVNINNNNGIQIAFTPQIGLDTNYYGQVKYPQGFAFIFSSNQTQGVIGALSSGLGYDGINNAIVFEFDFIQNVDKNDVKSPHFSVHYNLNGPVSSVSPTNCVNMCNIPLPNFYDNNKANYIGNSQIKIQIFSGILYVFVGSSTLISGIEFPFLDSLMSNNNVYFGVSSSMTFYKSVTISTFSLNPIQMDNFPIFDLINSQNSSVAGQIIQANFYIQTVCGEYLFIFPQQLKNFILLVNSVDWTQNLQMNFDQVNYVLQVNITNINTIGNTILNPTWKNISGGDIVLQITPGAITLYDVCYPNYDSFGYLNYGNLFQQKNVNFKICSIDQFKNAKILTNVNSTNLFLLGYPNNIPAFDSPIIANNNDGSFNVSIELNGEGLYTIYNPNFIGSQYRYFELPSGEFDVTNSFGIIDNYFSYTSSNIIANQTITRLDLYIQDLGGHSMQPQDLIDSGCSFNNSYVQFLSNGSYTNIILSNTSPNFDGTLYFLFGPQLIGTYTFLPQIICSNFLYPVSITCNLCSFSIASNIPDQSRINLFSDFSQRSFLNTDLVNGKILYISLDEDANKKLTTVSFVDTSGANFLVNNLNQSLIYANITSSNGFLYILTAQFFSNNHIDLYLNSNSNTRSATFSPLVLYNLNFQITDPQFQINNITIPLSFVYHDDYLSNINLAGNTNDFPNNFLATYMPNNFTVRASSNLLLFKIIPRNVNGELTLGSSLNCSNVNLIINGQSQNVNCKLVGIFLYINANMSIVGSYSLQLIYSSITLSNIQINIINRNEINNLLFNSNIISQKYVSNITTNITLNSLDIFTTQSLVVSMVDIYNNLIINNYLINFDSIIIVNNNNLLIEYLYDGTFVIIIDQTIPGTYGISFTLTNGLQYNIFYNKTSTQIDPSVSEAKLIIPSNNNVGNMIYAHVTFKDFYYNIISDFINNTNIQALNNLNLFLIGPNNNIIQLQPTGNYSSPEFEFVTNVNVSVSGEYYLNAYYNNINLKCGICSIKLNPLGVNFNNTEAYLIGYKLDEKIPLNGTGSLLVDKTQNMLSVYFIFKDIYGNEVTITNNNNFNSLSLVNSTGYQILTLSLQENTNRFSYQITGSQLNIILNLLDGNYYLTSIGNSLPIYSIYLTSTISENIDPSPVNSYLIQNSIGFIGNIDVPGSILIAFRTINNKICNNIDLTQLSIFSNLTNTNISVNYLSGPILGFVTALVQIKIVGIYNLTILYKGQTIINNIIFKSIPGRLASIQFFNSSSSNPLPAKNGNYHLFQTLDIYGNSCGFNYLTNTKFNSYIIDITDSNKGQISSVNNYNPLTGLLTVKVSNNFNSPLSFNSLFFSSNQLQSNSIYKTLSISSSLAYLSDEINYYVGNTSTLFIQPMDSYRNNIINEFSSVNYSLFSVNVLLVNEKGESTFIASILSSTLNSTSLAFSFSFQQAGDYIFIPLYNSIPIICTMCRKKVISNANTVNLNLTKLQILSINGWTDKSINSNFLLFKNKLPLFKLIFYDNAGLKHNFNSSLDQISFSSSNVTFSLNSYLTPNGVLYLYLNDNSIIQYRQLNPIQNLTLTIKWRDNQIISYENFIYLNSMINLTSNSLCSNDPTPYWINNLYISQPLRTSMDLEIEFLLNDCNNIPIDPVGNQFFNLQISQQLNGMQFSIIPAETNGKFILIFSAQQTIPSLSIAVRYKNSSFSNTINLNVISSYQIGMFTFFNGANVTSSNDYGYFYISVTDIYNNTIERINNVINDICLNFQDSKLNNIPYRVTYNILTKLFVFEYPILYSDNFTISSIYLSSNSNILIYSGDDFSHSVFQFQNFSNTSFILRDNKYAAYMNSNIVLLTNVFEFTYYSLNLLTGEEFYQDIISTNLNNNTISFNVTSLPQFHIIVFIPKTLNIYNVACQKCLSINNQTSLVYSFNGLNLKNLYYHTLNSTLIINNLKENFIFVTESAQSTPIKSSLEVLSGFNYQMPNNFNIYIFGVSGSANNSTNTISQNNNTLINITSFSNNATSNQRANSYFSAIYSNLIYSFQVDQTIYLYIESRDSLGQLTSLLPQVLTSNNYLSIIIIPSSFRGISKLQINTVNNVIPSISSLNLFLNDLNIYSGFVNVIAAYPISLSVEKYRSISSNDVQYMMKGFDNYNNLVCDTRLNIHLNDNNN